MTKEEKNLKKLIKEVYISNYHSYKNGYTAKEIEGFIKEHGKEKNLELEVYTFKRIKKTLKKMGFIVRKIENKKTYTTSEDFLKENELKMTVFENNILNLEKELKKQIEKSKYFERLALEV